PAQSGPFLGAGPVGRFVSPRNTVSGCDAVSAAAPAAFCFSVLSPGPRRALPPTLGGKGSKQWRQQFTRKPSPTPPPGRRDTSPFLATPSSAAAAPRPSCLRPPRTLFERRSSRRHTLKVLIFPSVIIVAQDAGGNRGWADDAHD